MTGQQLWDATLDGDAAKVRTLPFINYQDAQGDTPLITRTHKGPRRCTAEAVHGPHDVTITKQLITAHSNVDLQDRMGSPKAAPPRDRKWACDRHEAAHCCDLTFIRTLFFEVSFFKV